MSYRIAGAWLVALGLLGMAIGLVTGLTVTFQSATVTAICGLALLSDRTES